MKTNNEKYIHSLYEINPWFISQNKLYDGDDQLISESLTSSGNARMGMRGNFEEKFSGSTNQGSYLGGIWYPEPTKVGWWKVGYPYYFGKTANSTNYIGFDIKVDGVELDLYKQKPIEFNRTLNLKESILYRTFKTKINNKIIDVSTKRALLLNDRDIALIEYKITASASLKLSVNAYLDSHVSNYVDGFKPATHFVSFWDFVNSSINNDVATVTTITKKNSFNVPRFAATWALKTKCSKNIKPRLVNQQQKVGYIYETTLKQGESITFYKFVSVVDTRYEKENKLTQTAINKVNKAYKIGFDNLLASHINEWDKRWKMADVIIDGDESGQQAIRYNIYQLFCTYDGFDNRLNIGPKGFTGEKYGGATYWDTEAYCLPELLGITQPIVAKSLLMYRYNQIPQAMHNAKVQGLKGTLYPMVTFDGIESHNEWEITMEEIHRNNTIAFAVHNYYSYTDDEQFLFNQGLEILVGIARFWVSRVTYSTWKNKYMILGVTGPNEFEHNVDNNWYTNYGAKWVLEYTSNLLRNKKSLKIKNKLKISNDEINLWNKIAKNMYFPYDEKRKVFLQQDNFLAKDLKPTTFLKPSDRPISQKWSWDHVLRSCYLKQADVLQGLYYWYSHFKIEDIENNFNFYEPMTVHESSLSPCVHAILAARINNMPKAIEMYKRTARLDLDNFNNDTKDGLHITSMAGSWLAIVHGFAGLITTNKKLELSPKLPTIWKSYSFNLNYHNHVLNITVENNKITISKNTKESLDIYIYNKPYKLLETLTINTKKR